MNKKKIAKIKLQAKLSGEKPCCENCAHTVDVWTFGKECNYGIKSQPYRLYENTIRYEALGDGSFRPLYAFCEKFEFGAE